MRVGLAERAAGAPAPAPASGRRGARPVNTSAASITAVGAGQIAAVDAASGAGRRAHAQVPPQEFEALVLLQRSRHRHLRVHVLPVDMHFAISGWTDILITF